MKYCRSDAENQMAVLIKLDQLIRYLKLDIISYPDNLRHIYFDLLGKGSIKKCNPYTVLPV